MGLIQDLFTTQWMMVLYGVIAAITAGAALMWSKYPVRWILLLLTIGVVFLSLTIRVPEIDPKLPAAFRNPYFKAWVLVLGLVAVYTLVHLTALLIRARRGSSEPDEANPARFADLESAWDEILMRLGQASYDVGSQRLFLILAPDEALAGTMVQASGTNLFATAPTAPEAPIHAYATADGLLVSCGGASAWGRQDAEGTERLRVLCEKILALNPDQPVLRGVAVLYPMDKATKAGALQRVGALRNDLQTIWSELTVRCPVLPILCLNESRSGFNEFAHRMPDSLRQNPVGFKVPVQLPFTKEVAQKGLSWFAQWFQSWSLNLMVQDYVNKEGNARLVEMNARMRGDLPALRDLLDASFSTHVRAEPILVRGCYFVACGPEPENHAFVAGLIKGPKSRLIANGPLTAWSGRAEQIERRYRLIALALGLGAAAVALPIWFLGIRDHLTRPGVNMGWLFWTGLGSLALCWIVGLCLPLVRARLFRTG